MCYECAKKRAAALKASPTRQAYNPVRKTSSSSNRTMVNTYGMPKVRMSFGKKKS